MWKYKYNLQRKLYFTFGRVNSKQGFVMICESEGQVLYQGKKGMKAQRLNGTMLPGDTQINLRDYIAG